MVNLHLSQKMSEIQLQEQSTHISRCLILKRTSKYNWNFNIPVKSSCIFYLFLSQGCPIFLLLTLYECFARLFVIWGALTRYSPSCLSVHGELFPLLLLDCYSVWPSSPLLSALGFMLFSHFIPPWWISGIVQFQVLGPCHVCTFNLQRCTISLWCIGQVQTGC